MTKNKLFFYVSASVVIASGMYGCSKIEKGFLSTNLYYLENPLVTTKGSVTVSSSLVIDGSTTPLTVELTKIVDEDGNDVKGLLTKIDSIQGFSETVTYLDSTLGLLNSKLTTTAAQPFSINPIGGRIQLTPATQYVPTGTYTISVKASNVRGSMDLPNACKIIINGTGDTYVDYGGYYGGSFDIANGNYINGVGVAAPAVVYSATATNKIIYKFIDQNGKIYNPKTGGLTSRTNRWRMKDFDPYYPEKLTDTSTEYQFPSVPNQFPVFTNPGSAIGIVPRGNYGIAPAIPAAHNSTGLPVFAFLDMAFLAKGTYVITVNFTDISWK